MESSRDTSHKQFYLKKLNKNTLQTLKLLLIEKISMKKFVFCQYKAIIKIICNQNKHNLQTICYGIS